ncbi:MAG TPA: hypothetical protein VE622_02885 [Nitrososphaeraceae archaeon]|nr:hypothetical protein [Nitrososphaeraceae archaeon]
MYEDSKIFNASRLWQQIGTLTVWMYILMRHTASPGGIPVEKP